MSVHKLKPLFCAIVFLAMPLTASGQAPAFIDQVFDFEDLSTAGFTNGGAAGPFVVADANGNNALQLQTSGAAGGAGNSLVVLNNALTGDFSSANSVLFDATNPNPTDLNVRFAFNDGASNVFISDDIVLAAGATDNLSFLLDSVGFAQPSGNATFAQTLANITQIRILHNPNVAIGGGAGLPQGSQVFDVDGSLIQGSLLVDNFVVSSAAPAGVPEPSSAALLLGLAGAFAARRRRS